MPSVLDAGRELDASFDEFPVDRRTIPQDRLDLANRARTSLIAWRGQFSPELVDLFLSTFGTARGVVLDPFVGSGTTLLEAGFRQISAYGTDVNPGAVYAARTAELMNMARSDRAEMFEQLRAKMLRSYDSEDKGASKEAIFVDRLVRDASRLELTVLANCLMLAYGPGGKSAHVDAIVGAFRRYEAICLALPFTEMALAAVEADARALPVGDNFASLIITSPPYVNVFNYHQNFRSAVEALGHKPLDVAQSEIGANRKHRGNRFLTVIQYCLDMWGALTEMRRVLAADGQAVVVVGRESNVRGCRFENGRALFAVAHWAGLRLETRMERVFTSRFGARVYEDILVLAASGAPATDDSRVRAIAEVQLLKAMAGATGDVRSDIEAALRVTQEIAQSPLLRDQGPEHQASPNVSPGSAGVTAVAGPRSPHAVTGRS